MTWFSRPALSAAFAAGLLSSFCFASEVGAEPPAEIVAGSGPGRVLEQAESDDASVLPPDLSALSREELETLVRQLAADNAVLRESTASDEDGDTAAPDAETDAKPDLRDTVAEQTLRIDALEAQLAALLQRVNDLAPGSAPESPSGNTAENEPAPDNTPESVTPEDPATATPSDGPGSPAAEPDVGEYLYTYEYGLIREAGRGRVTLRDRDGKRQTTRYDYSEYRDDAVWVTLYFKNDADRPLRYTGLVALGGKQNFNDKRPPLLAQTPFRTPVLQPGEVFDLSQEIDVERPWRVDVVELGKVRSYPAD